MRCKCGAFLKSSQKRCKACAVEYLKAYDTDFFERQVQDKPVVLDFTPEQIKRWEEMSSKTLPRVPSAVRPWNESEWDRQQRIRTWLGVALLVVVVALAAYALVLVLRG